MLGEIQSWLCVGLTVGGLDVPVRFRLIEQVGAGQINARISRIQQCQQLSTALLPITRRSWISCYTVLLHWLAIKETCSVALSGDRGNKSRL